MRDYPWWFDKANESRLKTAAEWEEYLRRMFCSTVDERAYPALASVFAHETAKAYMLGKEDGDE